MIQSRIANVQKTQSKTLRRFSVNIVRPDVSDALHETTVEAESAEAAALHARSTWADGIVVGVREIARKPKRTGYPDARFIHGEFLAFATAGA